MKKDMKEQLYQTDFHAWSREQAQLVRDGDIDHLDRLNIAEELESLGEALEARLERRFELYLMHRLKWEYQPGKRTRSWTLTINEQHRQAVRLVHRNPSLKPLVRELFDDAYIAGRVSALVETGLDEDVIPAANPFSLQECFPELAEA